jgi:hypothetical protein
MPRRHPRAVYEVYDAEEMLGEHGRTVSGGERVDAERGPEAEQAASGANCGQDAIVPQQPERWAPGRMLAGVLLCVVAVCALAAIGIALLHVLGGAGAAHRLAASPPPRPTGVRREALAPLKDAEVTRPTEALTRPGVATPAQRVGHAQAVGPIDRHDPLRHVPAGLGGSPEPQAPWAPPTPSLGCDCGAAEVEFGFER